MKTWYSTKMLADTSLEIRVYAEIGYWGINANDFVTEVQGKILMGASKIVLRINSPGGEVFEALAMYNYLRSVPVPKEVYIDGIAASAAGMLAMVGDPVFIPANGMLMLHLPEMGTYGNEDEHQKAVDFLKQLRESVSSIYERKTSLPSEEITEILRDVTYLRGQAAIDKGFADVLLDAIPVESLRRSTHWGSTGKIPVEMLAEEEAEEPKAEEPKAEEPKAEEPKAVDEAEEIKALCALHKKSSADFPGLTLEEVRAKLLAEDSPGVDPGHGMSKPVVSVPIEPPAFTIGRKVQSRIRPFKRG